MRFIPIKCSIAILMLAATPNASIAQVCFFSTNRNLYENTLLNQVLDAERQQRNSLVCRLGEKLHDEYETDLDQLNANGCQAMVVQYEALSRTLAETLQQAECE